MSPSVEYNALRYDVNDDGDNVTFACQYLSSVGNQLDQVLIPSYYELGYPCDSDPESAKSLIASRLLSRAAQNWGILPDGHACDDPTFSVDGIWLVEVSSLPGAEFVDLNCTKVDETCCKVVGSNMTFVPQGMYQSFDMMVYVAQELDSEYITDGTPYQTKFIGSEMEVIPNRGAVDTGDTDSGPSGVQAPIGSSSGSGEFTVIGGFLLGGIIAAIVGIMFSLVRRRKYEKSLDLDSAMARVEPDPSEPTLEVQVLSDFHPPELKQSNLTDSFDAHEDGSFSGNPPSSYTFDLGRTFKNEIMGTYGDDRQQRSGPTTMEVVPPYPMEEHSDNSEVDSWAQTDGTVGSLEERLEEITVEI